MRSLAAAGLVAVATCAAAGSLGASATLVGSGLRGVVMRAPTRPVCVETEPCSAPAKHTTIVFSRVGHTNVATRTDDNGRYRVALAPGLWTVRTAATPAIGRGIEPRTVRVYAGRFRVANFTIDTGIR